MQGREFSGLRVSVWQKCGEITKTKKFLRGTLKRLTSIHLLLYHRGVMITTGVPHSYRTKQNEFSGYAETSS